MMKLTALLILIGLKFSSNLSAQDSIPKLQIYSFAGFHFPLSSFSSKNSIDESDGFASYGASFGVGWSIRFNKRSSLITEYSRLRMNTNYNNFMAKNAVQQLYNQNTPWLVNSLMCGIDHRWFNHRKLYVSSQILVGFSRLFRDKRVESHVIKEYNQQSGQYKLVKQNSLYNQTEGSGPALSIGVSGTYKLGGSWEINTQLKHYSSSTNYCLNGSGGYDNDFGVYPLSQQEILMTVSTISLNMAIIYRY